MFISIEICWNYLISKFFLVQYFFMYIFCKTKETNKYIICILYVLHIFNKGLSTSFSGSSKLIPVPCIKNTKPTESQLQKIKTFFLCELFFL